MIKRTCKEFKFKNDSFFNIYGTVDKNDPKVIYIKSKTKIYNDNDNDNNVIESLKYDFEKMVRSYFKGNENIHNEFIIHTECSENSIKIKRNCFFKYDLYVKPCVVKMIDEQKEIVFDMFNNINSILLKLFEKYKLRYKK